MARSAAKTQKVVEAIPNLDSLLEEAEGYRDIPEISPEVLAAEAEFQDPTAPDSSDVVLGLTPRDLRRFLKELVLVNVGSKVAIGGTGRIVAIVSSGDAADDAAVLNDIYKTF